MESKKVEEGGTAGRRRMLVEDEDAEDKRGGAERKMRYERKEDKNYDEEA